MEISTLLAIAFITVLVSFLWAASVAFTFWDARRRDLTGFELLVWVGLAVLLPFLGTGLYIFSRLLVGLFSSGDEIRGEDGGRSTALKPQPELGKAAPTFLAAELVNETIADPALDRFPPSGNPAGGLRFRCSVLEGPCLGKRFSIDALPARIGRGAEASIRLDEDLGVSRRQAEIYEREGRLRIRDLNSTHGTRVNGADIDDVGLEAGDRIEVGLSVLQIDPMGR